MATKTRLPPLPTPVKRVFGSFRTHAATRTESLGRNTTRAAGGTVTDSLASYHTSMWPRAHTQTGTVTTEATSAHGRRTTYASTAPLSSLPMLDCSPAFHLFPHSRYYSSVWNARHRSFFALSHYLKLTVSAVHHARPCLCILNLPKHCGPKIEPPTFPRVRPASLLTATSGCAFAPSELTPHTTVLDTQE